MNLNISARVVMTIMSIIISFLVIAHSIQAYLFLADLIEYVDFLDLDVERNLPTFYSSVAIEMCALLLLFVYLYNRHIGSNYRWAWLGLTIIFIFLGIDEATKIHENFGDMVEPLVDAQGVLYFPWVLPYSIAVLILAALYIPWLIHIPNKTRIRFIISAIVFLSGAIGMEVLSALYAEEFGTASPQYTWTYTVEETLEMLGIALFARALILHIKERPTQLTLHFTS